MIGRRVTSLMLPAFWLVGASDCRSSGASRAETQSYVRLAGALTAAETTFVGMRGRYAAYRVRLRNDGALEVTGRLLRPSGRTPPHTYAAVLLANGRELNSSAIEHLPREFGDVVVLALDYPEELPYELELGSLIARSDALRKAARRIPATFILGVSFLASDAAVDSSRIALVASSFGVPFAVIAAAADQRVRNVGLIYGAGRMQDVIAANLTLRPRFVARAGAWMATLPFSEFAPERFVAQIAPRPIVMVNGANDPQMPRAAVEALYAAARQPKSLIWLQTGHLMPGDTALIRALTDTALGRLAVLRSNPRR